MIVVSKLLWGFNFDKAKDPKTGLPIDLDIWNYTPVCLHSLNDNRRANPTGFS